MSDAILTRARRAVWSAIDHWPGLEGRFRRTWRFDDAGAMQSEPVPAFGELPALAIFPDRKTSIAWEFNQAQSVPYALAVKLWTPHWALALGEEIWQEIAKALFQSARPSGPTFIQSATGQAGVEIGPLAAARQTLGKDGPKCIVWEWSIVLQLHWNPALP